MASSATLYHLEVALSDVDRGVYEALDLRAAQHPSETLSHLLTRTLALCLFWEDGIAFSKGLSTNDEPAVWVRTGDGRVRLWIDIGHPSGERLHKASKAAERVVVCTADDLRGVRRVANGTRIHRAEHIEVVALPRAVLGTLEASLGRNARFEVVHTGGRLYVTIQGRTAEGEVERGPLIGA